MARANKPAASAKSSVAKLPLHYVNDAEPGIRRRRAGKGFAYLDANGKTIRDARTLARIGALAVPPAYTDVWICADACGHLQATGRDARGRKQYRYHAQWGRFRDAEKYQRLLRFGQRLPSLRRRLRHDLNLAGLPREKVLAVVVSLLMETRIRIGNAEYARENGSYGLTTLRSRHVEFLRGSRALFHFRGKSGQMREAALDDKRLGRLVRRCQNLPGQALFQYIDDEGKRHGVDSTQVNDYLRAIMGESFSAKDFRTWIGTLTAIALLARTPLPNRGGDRAHRAAIAQVIGNVAVELGNTPAVCRKSYVCPQIFDGWREGALHRGIPETVVAHPRQLETRALRLLRRCLARGAQKAEGRR